MKKPDYENNTAAWFTAMEIFARKGDFERAAHAKKELERLGVFVRFKGKLQRRYKAAEKVVAQRQQTFLGSTR